MVAYNISGGCARLLKSTQFVDTLQLVDHSSPLLTQTGSWVDTPANDTLAGHYSSSSLHTTAEPGAQVSFTLTGTGVWFHSGKRPAYGSYALSIDGFPRGSGPATSSEPLLNQYLIGASNLTMGEHKAVSFNAGGGVLDFDYLVFETDVGGSGCVSSFYCCGGLFDNCS